MSLDMAAANGQSLDEPAIKAKLLSDLQSWLDGLSPEDERKTGILDVAAMASLAWAENKEDAPPEEIYLLYAAWCQAQAVRMMCAERGFDQLQLYDMRQVSSPSSRSCSVGWYQTLLCRRLHS